MGSKHVCPLSVSPCAPPPDYIFCINTLFTVLNLQGISKMSVSLFVGGMGKEVKGSRFRPWCRQKHGRCSGSGGEVPEHLRSNAQVPLRKVPHIGPCNNLGTHQGVDLPFPCWYPPCDPRGEKAVQDKKNDMVIMVHHTHHVVGSRWAHLAFISHVACCHTSY